MGLSLPAPIDFASGRVFGPFALVDNDSNLMASAEHRNFWPEEDHFFFLKAGTGIGSGILIGGEFFRGARGTAGDVGYVQLDASPLPLCRCGKLACLEAYASGWAMARDLCAQGFAAQRARDVLDLLGRNTPEAIHLVRVAGRCLGEVAAQVVSVLNPNRIVVGGSMAQAEAYLLPGVRELISQRCLPLATRQLAIEVARLGDRAGALGAAQLVIDERLRRC